MRMRLAMVLILLMTGTAVAQERPPGPKEFFPFGVYVGGNGPMRAVAIEGMTIEDQIEWTCADLAKHHFNCVWPNNLSPKYLPVWLEAAERHNLRVIPQGGGMPMYLLYGQRWPNWQQYVETKMKPWWHDFAGKYRDSKALLAYSVVEEIRPEPEVCDAIASLTRLVAEVDPNHPMIVLHNKLGAAQMCTDRYRPAAIGHDLYPFFKEPGPDDYPNPWTRQASHSCYEMRCDRLYEIAERVGAPGWIMGQGMQIDHYKDGKLLESGYRRPTRNEMHYQVWAGLFSGLRGVFFYLYADGNREAPENGSFSPGLLVWDEDEQRPVPSDIYQEAAQIAARLEPLYPLLLDLRQGKLTDDVVVWEWNEHIRARTFVNRKLRNARYLMIFNDDVAQEHAVRLDLGPWHGYLPWDSKFYDVFQRRPIKIKDHNYFVFEDDEPLVIAPGDGTIVLVGDDDDIARHKQRYEQ